jgi:two-component system, LuxR family, sensor histidine kinase TtrS
MMKTVLIVAMLCATLTLSAQQSCAEIKMGVLAQRGPDIALREWGGIGQYLSEKMGEKVTIVPVSFSDFLDWCKLEPAAFIVANPWFFVRAKVFRNAKPLVTVKYSSTGSQFGGVILATKQSGIKTIADLKGKVLMAPKFSSPGGWLFQKGAMVKLGFVPERDARVLVETPKESHDEVVFAVRDGKADVGFVRTNMLETMEREGKIKIADFVILNPQSHEGFPEVCSTPLYPEWVVASLGSTPPSLANKMKAALLAIPPRHEVLQQARKIEQFVDALDYGPMEELCKLLQVEPFRKAGLPKE